MSSNVDLNFRPDYDDVIKDIAEYVTSYNVESKEAIDTARNCLIDSIGCGLLALQFKECTKHLGPIVEGTVVPNGSRVPGTNFIMENTGKSLSYQKLHIIQHQFSFVVN